MFVMTETRLFWWPVTIQMPDPTKAGELVEHQFEMQFEAIDDTALQAIEAEIQAIEDPIQRRARQHDVLLRVCRDWRDVVGPDHNPLSFSLDRLKAAINQPWFRIGVYVAYNTATAGVDSKARRKN